MTTAKGKTRRTTPQPKIHEPAPVRTDSTAAHWELDRTIELVVRNAYTGEIVARTGILVSNVEADHLAAYSGIESLFNLDLSPANGAAVPDEFAWHDRYKSFHAAS